MAFQRARSEEQRTERRRMILETAGAMLTELSVAQLSLNELSRRVGLAKSNVLRYFESREAVLFELLDAGCKELLTRLDVALPAAVDAAATPMRRGDAVAAELAAALTERPVLCDLISAQAAVLERNVSTEVAAKYKRAVITNLGKLADLVRVQVPELGEHGAGRFAMASLVLTAALWPTCQPTEAMLAVYEADPSLAVLRVEFSSALREALEIMLSGLLVRAST